MIKNLESILLQSKINRDNPALFQVIDEILKNVKSLVTGNTSIAALRTEIDTLAARVEILESGKVTFLYVNTLDAPVSINLAAAVPTGIPYVIKDLYGNAATNNITLLGIVEGVTNPVINTDLGLMRIIGTVEGYESW